MILGFLRRKNVVTQHADAAAAPSPDFGADAPRKGSLQPKESGDDARLTLSDLAPARRQGSQVNLNRLLAGQQHGLAAALKNPALSMDPATGQSGPTQAAPSSSGPDAAPMRRMRERRKSLTLTEMSAVVQNLEVSQAAMIMMPQRLRQELQQQQQQAALPAASQPAPLRRSNDGTAVLPALTRPPRPDSSRPDHASTAVSRPGVAAGASGVLSGMEGSVHGAARGIERKPSIIREAVKQQQRLQYPPPDPRNPAGSHGGEQQATLMALASALAGQGPDRCTQPKPAVLTSPQLGLPHNALAPMNGSSGRSLTPGGPASPPGTSSTAAAPGSGSQPAASSGSQRRSEPGEAFRGRAAVAAPAPIDVVINNVRGLNRSWGSAEEASQGVGGLAGNASSSKDLRRSQPPEEAGAGGGTGGGAVAGGSDVRLPTIAGARRKSVLRTHMSAADVLALTDAMAQYQSEAGRLRASALRKVDSRIQRAVMERHKQSEEGESMYVSQSSGVSGGGFGASLPPSQRSPVLKAGVPAAHTGPPRAQPPAADARPLAQEAAAETHAALSHLQKGSFASQVPLRRE